MKSFIELSVKAGENYEKRLFNTQFIVTVQAGGINGGSYIDMAEGKRFLVKEKYWDVRKLIAEANK